MISQSAYFAMCKYIASANKNESVHFPTPTLELLQFTKPHVLIIHRPTRRGFYLDQQYRHIVDVKNCQEPKNPTKVARHHLCPSNGPPVWVKLEKIKGLTYCNNFDSFWLY